MADDMVARGHALINDPERIDYRRARLTGNMRFRALVYATTPRHGRAKSHSWHVEVWDLYRHELIVSDDCTDWRRIMDTAAHKVAALNEAHRLTCYRKPRWDVDKFVRHHHCPCGKHGAQGLGIDHRKCRYCLDK